MSKATLLDLVKIALEVSGEWHGSVVELLGPDDQKLAIQYKDDYCYHDYWYGKDGDVIIGNGAKEDEDYGPEEQLEYFVERGYTKPDAANVSWEKSVNLDYSSRDWHLSNYWQKEILRAKNTINRWCKAMNIKEK